MPAPDTSAFSPAGTVHAGEHDLTPGQSVFVPAGEKAEVWGTGTVFRATVVI